ncbi:hypothetical protein JW756_04240 [Candidatus Woesearchaeota archaeon]|nr:hypothetical protein [Candidatus Woesearchaeota archaeon]
MNKRGAYFFVIDAMIAGIIIFLTLILIFTTHSLKPESEPTLRMMTDYTNFLTNTQIRQFQGSYVESLINDSNITNLDNTLVEQLVEFHYFNNPDLSNYRNTTAIMKGFVLEISEGIIPDERSFSIYLNNESIYERSMLNINNSKLVLSSHRILFKIINSTYIYGPIIIEVRIWV